MNAFTLYYAALL